MLDHEKGKQQVRSRESTALEQNGETKLAERTANSCCAIPSERQDDEPVDLEVVWRRRRHKPDRRVKRSSEISRLAAIDCTTLRTVLPTPSGPSGQIRSGACHVSQPSRWGPARCEVGKGGRPGGRAPIDPSLWGAVSAYNRSRKLGPRWQHFPDLMPYSSNATNTYKRPYVHFGDGDSDDTTRNSL